MNEYVYLKVTHDKYELPLAVARTQAELALILGITENNIASSMSHARNQGKWSPYRKVKIEEVEE